MTDTDALDAGLLAVADGLMDIWFAPQVEWRTWESAVEFRDAILAALRSERVRGEESMRDRAWQPIETAPKDGTRILVCGPDKNGSQYQDVTGWPRNWTGDWPTTYMAYAAGPPTHWMPLPVLPTTDQETTHG
mgnify:CR=1 FL=1